MMARDAGRYTVLSYDRSIPILTAHRSVRLPDKQRALIGLMRQ
jgi:hypothetical protein